MGVLGEGLLTGQRVVQNWRAENERERIRQEEDLTRGIRIQKILDDERIRQAPEALDSAQPSGREVSRLSKVPVPYTPTSGAQVASSALPGQGIEAKALPGVNPPAPQSPVAASGDEIRLSRAAVPMVGMGPADPQRTASGADTQERTLDLPSDPASADLTRAPIGGAAGLRADALNPASGDGRGISLRLQANGLPAEPSTPGGNEPISFKPTTQIGTLERQARELQGMADQARSLSRRDQAWQYEKLAADKRKELRSAHFDDADRMYRISNDPESWRKYFNTAIHDGISVDKIEKRADGNFVLDVTNKNTGKSGQSQYTPAQLEELIKWSANPENARAAEGKRFEEMQKLELDMHKKRFDTDEQIRADSAKEGSKPVILPEGSTAWDTTSGKTYSSLKNIVIENADGSKSVVTMQGGREVGRANGSSDGLFGALPKVVHETAKDAKTAVRASMSSQSTLEKLDPKDIQEHQRRTLEAQDLAENLVISSYGSSNGIIPAGKAGAVAEAIVSGRARVIQTEIDDRQVRIVDYQGQKYIMDWNPLKHRAPVTDWKPGAGLDGRGGDKAGRSYEMNRGGGPTPLPREPIPLPPDAGSKFSAMDTKLGLPAGTMKGLIQTESNNDGSAISKKGARGFAQIMPETQATLERRAGRKFDPENFDDALEMSGMVLAENIQKFGNLTDALKAYNGGWDKSKWGNPETAQYPVKIAKVGGTSQAPRPQVGLTRVSGGGMPAALQARPDMRPGAQAGSGSAGTVTGSMSAIFGASDEGTVARRELSNAIRTNARQFTPQQAETILSAYRDSLDPQDATILNAIAGTRASAGR